MAESLADSLYPMLCSLPGSIMPTCCPHPRIWAGALESRQFCRATLRLPLPPRRAGCSLSPHSTSPGLSVTREGQWRRMKVLEEEGGLLWLHYMEWPPSLPSTIHSFIHSCIHQSVSHQCLLSTYSVPGCFRDIRLRKIDPIHPSFYRVDKLLGEIEIKQVSHTHMVSTTSDTCHEGYVLG